MSVRPREPRRRQLLALLGADAISLGGNAMAVLAIPWFVLQTTASASKTGLAAAAALLPLIVSGGLGGALVDRIGYRRTSVIADLASGVATAAIPLLHITIGISLWQLLALVFLGGLLDTPGSSARAALLPDAAEKAAWTIERVTGAAAVVERGSRLVAAPLAGVLLAAFGATAVLWIDAATFVVSSALVFIAVPATRSQRRGDDQQTYLADVREGYRYLRGEPVLMPMVLIITATNMLDAVSIVALPVYARDVYGSALALGVLSGAIGGGAVIGAIAFSAFGDRVSRRRLFSWGLLIVTAWYLVAAAFPPLWAFVAAMIVAGIAAGPVNPVVDTVLLERVPVGLRGRVFGAVSAMAWGAMPLGVLIAGPLVDRFGLRATFVGTGALYFSVALAGTWIPSLSAMDRTQDRPSDKRAWRAGAEPTDGA